MNAVQIAKRLAAVVIAASFLPAAAYAQSSPGWSYGFVPTPAQWNAAFAVKLDYTGTSFLPLTGGTLSGELVTAAAAASGAGLNLPQGVAPTSPQNGDVWITSAGMFAQVNGVTVTIGSASCVNCALVNNANNFSVAQVVNLNAASLAAAQSGTALRIAQLDGTAARIEIDSFAAGALFTGVRADGTAASPTTLQTGDLIAQLSAHGYNGSAYTANGTGLFRIFASQNWTVGANGSYADIGTTANGTTTQAEVARFENDGGITVPSTVTGGDEGAGTINAAGLYQAGVQVAAHNATLTLGSTALTLGGTVTTVAGLTLTSPTINSGTFGTAMTLAFATGGGAQCLHVNNSGAISATGSDCGSGGSGAPGGSSGQLQWNSGGVFAGTSGATTSGSVVTLTLPVLVYGTGSGQNISATSANTAFNNVFEVQNSGTQSNAATVATIGVDLASANTSLNMFVTGGASPSASIASGSAITAGLTISAAAGPLTLVTPTFTFGTGSAQTISASSSNTGFANSVQLANNGTSSNTSTIAQYQVSLTCSNCTTTWGAQGAASPTAFLTTGVGMSGGFAISSGAGNIAITAASGSGITLNGGLQFNMLTGAAETIYATSNNPGFANQLVVQNSASATNSSTQAGLVVAVNPGNAYGIFQINNAASPNLVLSSGSGTTGGFNISAGAGQLSIASPNLTGTVEVAGFAMTFPGSAANIAALNVVDQTLSGGVNVTAFSIGTVSSGTSTIDCGKGPLQYLTNGGAFTLAAPANDGSCVVYDTNNGSAGAITFSGFTVNASYTGAAPDTVNGHKFMISITRVNGSAIYTVIPQQ